MPPTSEGIRQRVTSKSMESKVVEKPDDDDKKQLNCNLETIPFSLKPWVSLRKSLPDVRLCGLNVSVTLFSIAFLFCVRQLAFILFEVNGWPQGTKENYFHVACICAMGHSTPMILALFQCLLDQPYIPTMKLVESPLYWQLAADSLLQYCTGYMIQDSFFTFYRAWVFGEFEPSDILFLGHHFATVSYMTQCRWIGAGYISTMSCILIGEISNPVMMVWYITKDAVESTCCNSPRVATIFRASELVYAFVYLIARAIFMPGSALQHFYTFFLSGQKNISMFLCVYWYIAILAVQFGSLDYIVESWNILTGAF